MIIRGKGDIVAEIPERRTERGEGGESFHHHHVMSAYSLEILH